jgi:hypothetical protein
MFQFDQNGTRVPVRENFKPMASSSSSSDKKKKWMKIVLLVVVLILVVLLGVWGYKHYKSGSGGPAKAGFPSRFGFRFY